MVISDKDKDLIESKVSRGNYTTRLVVIMVFLTLSVTEGYVAWRQAGSLHTGSLPMHCRRA